MPEKTVLSVVQSTPPEATQTHIAALQGYLAPLVGAVTGALYAFYAAARPKAENSPLKLPLICMGVAFLVAAAGLAGNYWMLAQAEEWSPGASMIRTFGWMVAGPLMVVALRLLRSDLFKAPLTLPVLLGMLGVAFLANAGAQQPEALGAGVQYIAFGGALLIAAFGIGVYGSDQDTTRFLELPVDRRAGHLSVISLYIGAGGYSLVNILGVGVLSVYTQAVILHVIDIFMIIGCILCIYALKMNEVLLAQASGEGNVIKPRFSEPVKKPSAPPPKPAAPPPGSPGGQEHPGDGTDEGHKS